MKLIDEIVRKESVVCVGIDPILEQMPSEILRKDVSVEEKLYVFSKEIVDGVKDEVAAIKLQIAFFEQYGLDGLKAYDRLAKYIRKKGVFLISDVKRGDIGSAAKAYSRAYIEKNSPFESDAITINPFFGSDSNREFYDTAVLNDKMVFQVIKTENPSSSELQDLVVKKEKIHEILAKQIAEETKYLNKYETVGVVVGTTDFNELKVLREILKQRMFLISRYGFQGAGLDKIKYAFNDDSLGAIVNSSSKIMYAHQNLKMSVSEGAYTAAKKMKTELNTLR